MRPGCNLCRSSAEAEGHNGGANGAAEGDAAAAHGGPAAPLPASSIVEVFLGGLAPSASEAGVRAALGAWGILPSLSWVRLQMKSEGHEEGDDLYGGGGASCTGVAHLGFTSRPAAIQACHSVRQVS